MILSCGDALIDMVPIDASGGQSAYAPRVGGSCLNVAVALARLGTSCGFVGGISSDFFGQMIRQRLLSAGVDLRYATVGDRDTTLAFVSLDQKNAEYVFYDTATASRSWIFEADLIEFDNIKAIHIGSVTLIAQPSASSFEALAFLAHSKCIVSFDPNCRPTLVTDHLSYRNRMATLARRSDIIRYSAEDFDYLYPGQSEDDVVGQLMQEDASLVVITRGGGGSTAFTRRCRVSRPAPATNLVDTIGAGDTFQAGLLTGLSERGQLERQRLASLDKADLASLLDFAMLAASKTCEKVGADPPFRTDLAHGTSALA